VKLPSESSVPSAGTRSGKRVTNRLVALSSAAVLTVYSAGYLRTRAAADKLFAAERARIVIPTEPHAAMPPPAQSLAIAGTPPTAPAGTPTVTRDAVADATPRSATVPASPSPAVKSSPVSSPAADAAPTAAPAATTSTPTATPTPTPGVALTASPTPSPSPTPAAPAYKDGTFSGWGTSRHGDIEATVIIENGKIASAVISQCLTRYSCSWVSHLQGQVVTRQSPEVDYVTGATQSTNAFYYAVVQALSKAK